MIWSVRSKCKTTYKFSTDCVPQLVRGRLYRDSSAKDTLVHQQGVRKALCSELAIVGLLQV